MLFPLPLDTIKIYNLTNDQRLEIVNKFNDIIYNSLTRNGIPVIYPKEELFGDSSQVKDYYLHIDNLHLNAKARSIYLKKIEQLSGMTYIEKSSIEYFKYSHEIDVFVYLWLSDCNICFKQTCANKFSEQHQTSQITIESFFNSLHHSFSDQESTHVTDMLESDKEIMQLNEHYIRKLQSTLDRVLPHSIPYGIVFFWQALWAYQRGDIEKAIELLKKSISEPRHAAFHDRDRVNHYINLWQSIH